MEKHMKNLYIIGGTMGVGKTTVSQIMKMKLCNSVFLDGDWCWDSNPFRVTEETKEMVIQYILEKSCGKLLILSTHQEEDALLLGGETIHLE